jgi:hypothetical protein
MVNEAFAPKAEAEHSEDEQVPASDEEGGSVDG